MDGDHLKQNLAAKAARLKRYVESKKRRQHNNLFENNERALYKKLNINERKHNPPDAETPDAAKIMRYWNELWSTPVTHANIKWIRTRRR
ncbi:hypothetical protein QE152_g1960 [Popillia japonica]|uniref:Uncharacterized protein n=1 Tax=Popillia japonica TaxID=7064 RepID=A0AAW1N754_POPJA